MGRDLLLFEFELLRQSAMLLDVFSVGPEQGVGQLLGVLLLLRE